MTIYNWLENEFIFPMKDILNSKRSFKNPIIIHQMGKVASKSIYYSLINVGVTNEIYRTHLLTNKTFKEWNGFLDKRREMDYERSILNQVKKGKWLSNRIVLTKNKNVPFKVITLVREPISYLLSYFFQSIYGIYSNVHEDYQNSRIKTFENIKNKILEGNDAIVAYLLSRPFVFFEQEIKKCWSVDIYSSDFPKDVGYKIYSSCCADVLLLKFESLDMCISSAINDFLGIDGFKLQKTHCSSYKTYGSIYSDFLNYICFDESFIDKYYSSDSIKHFYSDAELECFRKTWLCNGK